MKVKGTKRLVLVSDVAPVAGLAPGVRKWGDKLIEYSEDGTLRLSGTPYLAGAGVLLDTDVLQFSRATGVPLEKCIRACTDSPATLCGVAPAPSAGVESGSVANFFLFDYDVRGESLSVRKTVHGSRIAEGSRSIPD